MEHPINNLDELQRLNEERGGGEVMAAIGSLKRHSLNQVRIVLKDKTLPISPENAFVYLNGQLLPLVKSVNLMIDTTEKIGIARLDLWAHFTVEEAPDGPNDASQSG